MKRPRILLAVALFSVSTSSVFARFLPEVPAIVIGIWRMLFAAGILWSFSGFRRLGKLSPSSYGSILIAGVFLGIHFACYFGALKYTSVAAATFLSTTAPIFTVVIEHVFLKRPWKAHIIVGVFLALLGALVVQFSFMSGFSKYMIGNALGVAASICMTIVLMLAEKIRKTEDALVYSRSMYLVAGLILIPIAVILDQPLFSYSIVEYRWLLLLGLIPTVIGHTSFYYAIKWWPPTIVASVPLGEPILASLWAWFFFAEIPTLSIAGGGLFILTGLFIITLRQPSTNEFQSDII